MACPLPYLHGEEDGFKCTGNDAWLTHECCTPSDSCALDPDEEGHRRRIIAAKDTLGKSSIDSWPSLPT